MDGENCYKSPFLDTNSLICKTVPSVTAHLSRPELTVMDWELIQWTFVFSEKFDKK